MDVSWLPGFNNCGAAHCIGRHRRSIVRTGTGGRSTSRVAMAAGRASINAVAQPRIQYTQAGDYSGLFNLITWKLQHSFYILITLPLGDFSLTVKHGTIFAMDSSSFFIQKPNLSPPTVPWTSRDVAWALAMSVLLILAFVILTGMGQRVGLPIDPSVVIIFGTSR